MFHSFGCKFYPKRYVRTFCIRLFMLRKSIPTHQPRSYLVGGLSIGGIDISFDHYATHRGTIGSHGRLIDATSLQPHQSCYFSIRQLYVLLPRSSFSLTHCTSTYNDFQFCRIQAAYFAHFQGRQCRDFFTDFAVRLANWPLYTSAFIFRLARAETFGIEAIPIHIDTFIAYLYVWFVWEQFY